MLLHLSELSSAKHQCISSVLLHFFLFPNTHKMTHCQKHKTEWANTLCIKESYRISGGIWFRFIPQHPTRSVSVQKDLRTQRIYCDILCRETLSLLFLSFYGKEWKHQKAPEKKQSIGRKVFLAVWLQVDSIHGSHFTLWGLYFYRCYWRLQNHMSATFECSLSRTLLLGKKPLANAVWEIAFYMILFKYMIQKTTTTAAASAFYSSTRNSRGFCPLHPNVFKMIWNNKSFQLF